MFRLFVILLLLSVGGAGAGQPAPAPTPDPLQKWQKFRDDFAFEWVRIDKDDPGVIAFTGVSKQLASRHDYGIEDIVKTAAAGEGTEQKKFGQITVRSFDGVRQYVAQQQYREKPGAPLEPIANAQIVVAVSPNAVYDLTDTTIPAGIVAPIARRSRASAIALAEARLNADAARFKAENGSPIAGCCQVEESEPAPDRTELIAVGKTLFRVYRVKVRAFVTTHSGQKNVALREYAIDAHTTLDASAVVEQKDLIHRFQQVQVRVFDPNPLVTLNQCNAVLVPDLSQAFFVESVMVNDPANGYVRLSGPNVEICDVEGPPTAPPALSALNNNAQFFFDTDSASFAAAMAYFHVDRMQSYVQGVLGFSDLVMPVQVDVDASDPDDTTVNSCYTDDPQGDGYLSFGKRAALFYAQDAEVIAHEYGHVLLSRTTAGRFGIARDEAHPDSEAGPISEGFADYWAISTFSEQARKYGHRLDCFADWAKGGPCLRTAMDRMFHDEFDPNPDAEVHGNGGIWSAMLFDLFRALAFKRQKADTIILLGHLNRAGRGLAPTMREIADGIVLADVQTFNGADKEAACAVFMIHGLENLPCCVDKECGAHLGAPLPISPLPKLPMKQKDHCKAHY